MKHALLVLAGALCGALITFLVTRGGEATPAPAPAAPPGADPGAATAAPPPRDATREQLLARDQTQRSRIAELSAQVTALERRAASPVAATAATAATTPTAVTGGAATDEELAGKPWLDPSAETLAAYAAECKLFFDMPLVADSEPHQLADGAALGLDPAELDVVNASLRELHARWRRLLIGLYIEATGDAEHAESLAPGALAREIEDKAVPGEAAQVRQRIARERAGLATPPADLSTTTPFERYLRAAVELGRQAEALLAAELGPVRARELRALGAWFGTEEMWGCPE